MKDEDEKSNEDFNFAAAGDFGCSENARNTVKNMEDKIPEVVLPLGDLSYETNANCWFDVMAPLKGKIIITLGFHDVNDGVANWTNISKVLKSTNTTTHMTTIRSIFLSWHQNLNLKMAQSSSVL